MTWPAVAPVSAREMGTAVFCGKFCMVIDGVTITPAVFEKTWTPAAAVGPRLVTESSRYRRPCEHLNWPSSLAHVGHSGRAKQTCSIGQHHPSPAFSLISRQTMLPGTGLATSKVPETV